jgi:hypothetical protein
MNKRLIILFAIVAVAGILYWIAQAQGWSTIKRELKDFAISDTSKITRVFLADKRGNSAKLTQVAEHLWMVNDSTEADISKINLLLSTMKEVSVRNPVSEASYNSVIASMATDGVKVEFYDDTKNLKTIYVGSSTPDQLGTYMLLEGSSAPFITHIQGFVGYLSPRFYPFAVKWKTRKVFDSPLNEIEKVALTYYPDSAQSFELTNNESSILFLHNGKQEAMNEQFAKFYLNSFTNLYLEGFDEQIKPKQVDSIKATMPFCTIQLWLKNGKYTKLQLHQKQVLKKTKQQYDDDGNPLKVDREKYFAFVNGSNDVGYAQEYAFKKVLKKYSDFKEAQLP